LVNPHPWQVVQSMARRAPDAAAWWRPVPNR